MEHQMINCYNDLEKILKHYGYTFDDVVAENIYTNNMADFIKVQVSVILFIKAISNRYVAWSDRACSIGALIEIDMEAHKTNNHYAVW